jgi:RimJ/RimL family protein N-acetyltransferase
MRVILETNQLILRTWESDDAEDALAIWGDLEVMRYVGKPLADLDGARRTLDSAAAAQERHGVSLWAVVEKASGKIVGACGFHYDDDGPVLELAYHFKPEHWGRGFATEASRACVRYAAETLHATKIVAGVKTGNPASLRVLEKLGFACEQSPTARENGDEQWFSLRLKAE